MLLTAAIERLTGQSLDEVLRTRIFQPLGMNDTMLRRWDTDFVPNSATLHMVNSQGHYTRDYMGLEQSERVLEWQRKWKAMWDPDDLLNPGKVLPARRAACSE